MSSLAELLAAMKGRSCTHGWDAIVVYDRDVANALLLQQTIERLAVKDAQIPPISGELKLGDASGTRLHLHGVQLNTLHLSFESAQRRSREATLRCAMSGGMIVTTQAAAGMLERTVKVEQILPVNGAGLSMELDLLDSTGSVSSIGGVTIDLYEGSNITSTLGDDEYMRLAVAAFFKGKFQQLGSERRRYSLGVIGNAAIPALTPDYFTLRVLNRSPGLVFPAAGAGEGLIELYIRFRGGQVGNMPGDNDPGLVPDDDQGRRYSGALLISSRVLFANVLRPQLVRDLGNGAAFSDFTGGSDMAWVLKASAGTFGAPFEHHYKASVTGFDGVFRSPMNTAFGPDGGQIALSVQSTGDGLSVTWARDSTTTFERTLKGGWPFPEDHQSGPFYFRHDFSQSFELVLGTNGVVSFRRVGEPYLGMTMRGHEWLPELGGGERSKINEVAKAHFLPAATQLLDNLTPPDIDSFVVRNLLFPGRDAMRLSTAHLPGDLFMAGRVSHPFDVLPSQAMLGAGGTLTFSTAPAQSGVRWTIGGVRGDTEHLGTINASTGVYQAPAASLLLQGFKAIIVTATVGSGTSRSSVSALLEVVREPVAVAPLFQTCAAGQPVTLAGFALAAGSLTAALDSPGNGGSLRQDAANLWTYTAPAVPQPSMLMETITVRQGGTALKKTHVLVLPPLVTLKLVLDGNTLDGGQLHVWYGDHEVSLDEVQFSLFGAGSVTPAGRYTPPASGLAGVDVITAMVDDRTRLWGYLVVPLTDAYPKGFRAVRDLFGTIHMTWDAIAGAVEYELTGFDRETLTTALKHSWYFMPGSGGIGTLSLRGRYADGHWSPPQLLRFYNIPHLWGGPWWVEAR